MRRRLLAGAALALLAWPATGHAQSGGRPSPHRPEARATAPPPPASPPAASRSRRARSARRARALPLPHRRRAAQRARPRRPARRSARAARPHASAWAGSARAARSSRTWTPPAGLLTPGDYVARLHAVDRSGRTLRRTATASGRSRLTVVAPPPPAPAPVRRRAGRVGTGVFPVRGAYTYGDALRRRARHRAHRGQDILAAEGTPVASPARRRRDVARLPGRGRRPLHRHPRRRRPRLRLHAPPGRLDHRAPRAPWSTAGQVFARSASTGRSTRPAPALRDLARPAGTPPTPRCRSTRAPDLRRLGRRAERHS